MNRGDNQQSKTLSIRRVMSGIKFPASSPFLLEQMSRKKRKTEIFFEVYQDIYLQDMEDIQDFIAKYADDESQLEKL